MHPTHSSINRDRFDAVLFDLDGVLTATAKVHATAWKRTFDELLKTRSVRTRQSFRPFDIHIDYKQYVDGRLREDGVRAFVESRDIALPDGEPSDSPDRETVHGVGNRKDQLVKETLATDGVEVFEGSVAWLRRVCELGLRTAVVSASRNCAAVLAAAGIAELFDTQVDGNTAAKLGLPGKPQPDTFLHAARELGVDAKRAVVVEDALSGVQAGRAGGFGLVIGVARKGNTAELAEHGADVVVGDLSELALEIR
jgi:beta-phosphoglucomutase family hydrolase